MKLTTFLTLLLLAGCGQKQVEPITRVEPITIDWCHDDLMRMLPGPISELNPSRARRVVPHEEPSVVVNRFGMCLDCRTGHIDQECLTPENVRKKGIALSRSEA